MFAAGKCPTLVSHEAALAAVSGDVVAKTGKVGNACLQRRKWLLSQHVAALRQKLVTAMQRRG